MTSASATAPSRDAERSAGVAFRGEHFRPELQAVRAAAVLLVVAYHFWPDRVPGGFVGVDVFFVVSGFLITSHLAAGFERDGRVSLPQFWARRARRLLPASLLVLAVSALGTLALVPAVQWQQAFREIGASALYVQNWLLAGDSIDYLAAENAPSPVQHFWSLSVEEQFYLTVPVLLVLAVLLARRSDAAGRRRALVITLALLAVASLAGSVFLTFTAPGPAYFVTPTRAWEFAAGGLASFAIVRAGRLPGAARAAIAWAGWAGMVVSAIVITPSTPFPGYAALLPVFATLAVIFAGRPPVPWAPHRLLVHPPVVALGDISYAVYLWHWPVLIFAQYRFGSELPLWVKLMLVAAVLGLSWATTRWVENPVRRGRFLVARRPLVTFAATAIAMALVAIPALSGAYLSRNAATAELEQAAVAVADAGECVGAGSRDPSLDCPPVTTDQLIPDPSAAIDDKSSAYDKGCIAPLESAEVPICRAGVSDGSVRVAVIGDSHAVQWLPALLAIASKRDWSITTLFKSACPYSAALNLTPPPRRQACRTWNEKVQATLDGDDPYDLVVVSNAVTSTVYKSDAVAIDGFRTAWKTLTDRGTQVVVIEDTPRATETTASCVDEHEAAPAPCDIPQTTAFPARDLEVLAAQGQSGAHVIDLTDYFCWDGTCKSAIGGVVTYRDSHHITATLSTTFGPVIGRRLDALGL